MGAPRAIALCQCFNGALEFQAGHWTEAETVLRESLRLYHELGAASGEALAGILGLRKIGLRNLNTYCNWIQQSMAGRTMTMAFTHRQAKPQIVIGSFNFACHQPVACHRGIQPC